MDYFSKLCITNEATTVYFGLGITVAVLGVIGFITQQG